MDVHVGQIRGFIMLINFNFGLSNVFSLVTTIFIRDTNVCKNPLGVFISQEMLSLMNRCSLLLMTPFLKHTPFIRMMFFFL